MTSIDTAQAYENAAGIQKDLKQFDASLANLQKSASLLLQDGKAEAAALAYEKAGATCACW